MKYIHDTIRDLKWCVPTELHEFKVRFAALKLNLSIKVDHSREILINLHGTARAVPNINTIGTA